MRGAQLTVATASKADALFEELCMTLPPETTRPQRVSATRARRYAKEQSWVPPLALEDLDEHDRGRRARGRLNPDPPLWVGV